MLPPNRIPAARDALKTLVGYGKLLLSYATQPQRLQVAGNVGTVRDQVMHALPYGLSTRPHAGAEVITLNMAGDTASPICICVADRRYHFVLENDGEVALYDDLGQAFHLTRSGPVITSTMPVTVNAPDMVINGISFMRHIHGGVSPGGSKTQPPG